jgi:hypothetical protein
MTDARGESLEAMLERHRNEIGATREPWINLVTRHHNESVEWYKNATYVNSIDDAAKALKEEPKDTYLLDQAALAILSHDKISSYTRVWEQAKLFVKARPE